MDSKEIRRRFLAFFEKRGHAILPSAPLVPENDPSVLFTTAGMQPLVPFLLGRPHPAGTQLANVQKCVRTQDIESVGDATHDTFFEMLGNWSLGAYFKEEAIRFSYEFLTSSDEGLGLDPRRLYITVFAGDSSTSSGQVSAPRDEESARIWQSLGIAENHIYYLPAKNNWWSPGENGPCGPDTEMFYDVTPNGLGELSHEQFMWADDNQQIVEIWNDVFMEYEQRGGEVVGKLAQKNVDTGAGLERLSMVLQKKENIFETDLFLPLIAACRESGRDTVRSERIVADHVRTAVFVTSDGVLPSNVDRGYILRRLIRRAYVHAQRVSSCAEECIRNVADAVMHHPSYENRYSFNCENVQEVVSEEIKKFKATLERGMKEFEKISHDGTISGHDAFVLFSSFGFPFELTSELAQEREIPVDEASYRAELATHQGLSRAGAEAKFKGGLAGSSEKEVAYHTATHLLQQALSDVLGPAVSQKGSNITGERLRFDFAHTTKLTDEEKQKVEAIVNEKIKENLPVQSVILSRVEAEATGARHFFSEKYGDTVSLYFIGHSLSDAYSKEFCGGPHVAHTGELGTFRILKEEAVSAGVRRIKAVLE